MNRRLLSTVCIACLSAWAFDATAFASDGSPVAQATLQSLPVKEVTIFKDGHAFVAHEGVVKTDARGHVMLDNLPAPVMGTFWPYARQAGARMTSVVVGNRIVEVDQTAMSVVDLIRANIGKRARLTLSSGPELTCELAPIQTRSSEELARLKPESLGPLPPEAGDMMMVSTDDGVRPVFVSHIRDVVFLDEPTTTLKHQRVRPLLTMKLAWDGDKPKPRAAVGMAYLQKGLRWVPNYRITIDGKGKAIVELQATLLNELADLDDVTVNLVIGVPRFEFDHTVDPIAMRGAIEKTTAQLSQYFQTNSQTAFALSNSMMTQVSRAGEHHRRAPAPRPQGAGADAPAIGDAEKSEDLFVFTVEHVTLARGERMVLPITRFELPYEDVYTLDLPIGPPPELRRGFNTQQQHQLAQLMHAPKFMHKLRLTNDSAFPLTTAPALILRGERLIAQGMMTYTPIGGANDLAMTQAVDLRVETEDEQTDRNADVHRWNGRAYDRVDMAGRLIATNRLDKPVKIEVRRYLLGFADETGGGDAATLSYWDWIQRWDAHPSPHGARHWWTWHSWPHYWWHVNSVSRITWKTTLQTGEKFEVDHTWHYFTD